MFEIQKSENGTLFYTIGDVISETEKNEYTFTDESAGNNVVYYRIAAIDLNGNKHFSQVIAVKDNSGSQMWVYPNPVDRNETLTIYGEPEGRDSDPVLVEWFDISGVLKKIAYSNSYR